MTRGQQIWTSTDVVVLNQLQQPVVHVLWIFQLLQQSSSSSSSSTFFYRLSSNHITPTNSSPCLFVVSVCLKWCSHARACMSNMFDIGLLCSPSSEESKPPPHMLKLNRAWLSPPLQQLVRSFWKVIRKQYWNLSASSKSSLSTKL